jgi:uncharacterized protein (DUF2147 family)
MRELTAIHLNHGPISRILGLCDAARTWPPSQMEQLEVTSISDWENAKMSFIARRIGLGALRSLIVAALVLGACDAMAQASAASPVGTWQTIDDQTGKPRALMQITRDDAGVLSGKIIKSLAPHADPERRCTACKGARKDQLIIGMTILTGMKQDGVGADAKWTGGEIVDPESGSIYHCEMHLIDAGQKLVVRGFVGVPLLGRSQTWRRQ